MAKIKEGSVIMKVGGDEVIATKEDLDAKIAEKVKKDVPADAKFTDTTYSEITTAEIDTGTASTRRTITGRRVKYILDKVSSMISIAIGELTKSSVGLGNVDNTSDASKPVSTATQTALNGKVNNSQVLTNVPAGAKFTDTHLVESVNNKTGEVVLKGTDIEIGSSSLSFNSNIKIDYAIKRLGENIIDNRDKKADKIYVDSKVKTDVPANAKFTDTVYTHPSTHPASMITESATKRFVTDVEKANWNSKGVMDIGTFTNQEELITYVLMSQLPTGQYSFIMDNYPYLMLLRDRRTQYTGVFFDSEGVYVIFNVGKEGTVISVDILELNEVNFVLNSFGEVLDGALTNMSQLMPRNGGTLGNYNEKLTTVVSSSGIINLNLGNVFQHTPSANTAYTISNPETGVAHSFTLIINMVVTARTLTFPTSVKWQDGEIPDMTESSKIYILTFMTIDGGTTWLGMSGGKFELYKIASDDDFRGTSNGAFNYIGSHEYVIIPHVIKGVNVTSYSSMLYNNVSTTLKGVASDNPNVTDMSSMFRGSQATTLDLSNFDTSNVTSMSGMFYGSQATTLDLSSFDTPNVTDMSDMFRGSQATTLDLSSFDTPNVTSMRDMFNISKATSLDLSSFDTSNVTDMSRMFRGSQATTLDLSSFDTSNVTNMSDMFYGSQATTGYARTQADADKFNASSNKPAGLTFVIK